MSDWIKKWLENNLDGIDGIDVSKQKPGTKIIARTKNSNYEFVVVQGREVFVRGGRHFPAPIPATFNGSTFGGSIMKIGWIGFMMCMEIAYADGKLKKAVTTTGVRSATVIGPDEDWTFDLDWPDLNDLV